MNSGTPFSIFVVHTSLMYSNDMLRQMSLLSWVHLCMVLETSIWEQLSFVYFACHSFCWCRHYQARFTYATHGKAITNVSIIGTKQIQMQWQRYQHKCMCNWSSFPRWGKSSLACLCLHLQCPLVENAKTSCHVCGRLCWHAFIFVVLVLLV